MQFTLDLRQRSTNVDTIRRIEEHAVILPDEDRKFLSRTLRSPITSWAESPKHARQLRRRARRLARQVMDVNAVTVRTKASTLFADQLTREIAERRFLQRHPIRRIARDLRLSLWTVRTRIARIETILDAHHTANAEHVRRMTLSFPS